MAALAHDRIEALLQPYCAAMTPHLLSSGLVAQLSVYLDLLLLWNARTNLTAIRNPEEIVQRHFGEGLFTAQRLPAPCATLLDFGSGAGFPGLPIQLACPELKVTLAESQDKKSAFLREVVRRLELKTQVWPGRVEDLPADRLFDVVTLRAVDKPDQALASARLRLNASGTIAHLGAGTTSLQGVFFSMPGPTGSFLRLEAGERQVSAQIVPRGTI